MLMMVYILYSLLCMPITVRTYLGLNAVQSSVQACVGTMGLHARIDAVLSPHPGGVLPHLLTRYGPLPHLPAKRRVHRRGTFLHMVLMEIVRVIEWRRLDVRMRLGTGKAWSTALISGAVRSLALSMMACLEPKPPILLRMDADFQRQGFVLTACCIFFVRPGDIMLAVLRAAVKKTRKEGFKWISIPLRV